MTEWMMTVSTPGDLTQPRSSPSAPAPSLTTPPLPPSVILSSGDESPSSSGFVSQQPPSPGSQHASSSHPSKGKGRAVAAEHNFGVEYQPVSTEELVQEQQRAVDYVTDMLGLKVSQPAAHARSTPSLALAEVPLALDLLTLSFHTCWRLQPGDAATLLRYFGWKKDNLVDVSGARLPNALRGFR